MIACLLKLGLEANQDNTAVPSLSRLHISSILPNGTLDLMTALKEIITIDDGEEYIKDDNDTFHLEKPSMWSLGSIAEALPKAKSEKTDEDGDAGDRILDYSTIVKRVIVHGKDPPASKQTPYFNHDAFYSNLQYFQSQTGGPQDKFGEHLMYGEVVTSTNTMLEKYGLRLSLSRFTLLTGLGIRRCFADFHAASQQPLQYKWLVGVEAPTCGFLLLARSCSPPSSVMRSL